MNAQKLVISLLSILFVNQIGLPEEEPAQELSNTRYASVEVNIISDPKIYRVGGEKVMHIINNSELFEAVWQEVSGVEHWDNYMNVPFVKQLDETAGMQMVRFGLMLTLPEEYKPAAKEYLQAYIKELQKALRKEYDVVHTLNENKLEVYTKQRVDAESKLHNLLNKQSQLAVGQGPLDKESVRQRILEHERSKIENSLQKSILRKRAEELVKQIDEVHRTTGEIEAIVAAIQELQEKRDRLLTEFNKSDFERNQIAKTNTGSQDQIVLLTSKLSSLETDINRIEREINILNKHEKQLESQTAGDIQELNRLLRETNIKLEELEIQDNVLSGYNPGKISDSIEYEILEVRIEAAKEELRRAILDLDKAALEYNLLQPPTVSYDKIISSETIPENN
jgi:hypothetical protein